MTMTLRAVSLNEQPLTQPIGAHFDSKGGTIGRHDDNTLALPDPERHISRRHAEIRFAEAGFTIRNVGSANPIVVRGQPLARGESTTLAHRDQVRIGGYLLEVVDDQSGEEGTTFIRSRASAEARSAAAPSTLPPTARGGMSSIGLGGPFADLASPTSGSDPFADLLGPGSTPAPEASRRGDAAAAPVRTVPPAPAQDPFADLMPPAAGVAASSPAWGTAAPAQAAPKLPDDFDPFARPPAVPPKRPVDAGSGAFDDLIPVASPASIDNMAALPPGSGDALADFLARPLPGPPGKTRRDLPGGVSTDPMQALFGAAAPAIPEPTARDDTPELRSAFAPRSVQQPIPTRLDGNEKSVTPGDEPPPVAAGRRPTPAPASASASALSEPSKSAPPAGTADADAMQLWAAFCEGAGVPVDGAPSPELMRKVGSLLRIAVDGTLRLMEVRRATKHELRAGVTVIQSRNNNPLKFAPDAQVALEQLLKPAARGFMPGPVAMTDAMHDLVSHSIGTMAGTRAALEGVLDRFAPAELESKLEGKSVIDSVLPMNRKARLWDLYLRKFEAIRAEAQDDFESLFGKAFVAAYEQQLERLEREKSVASRAADA